MAQMNAEQRNAFLKEPRIGKLVTLYADGSPTVVPIWYEWDGERARIFTSRDSPKLDRIRQDARVCLSVEEPTGVAEAWVTIEGTAAIVADGGFALAQRLAPRYYSPEKSARTLEEWGRDPEQWVVIEVTPTRIRSMAAS